MITNALQIFTLGYFVFGPFSLTLVHTLLKGSRNVGNVRSVEPSGKPVLAYQVTLKYVEIVVEALDGFRTSICSTECFVKLNWKRNCKENHWYVTHTMKINENHNCCFR